MALIRTCQKCDVFLEKFKEEIRLNPYTDVTPYTQLLANDFKKWNKAFEKRVINTLFLNLYAQDVKSLKRDLCKLEPQKVLDEIQARDTAKAKFPQRALLLGCLYNTLSLYIPDVSSYIARIIAQCEQFSEIEQIKYELIQEKYKIDQRKYEIELILLELKEELCHNPNANISAYSDKLVCEYDTFETACFHRIFKTLLFNLYAQDVKSLNIALTKIKMQILNRAEITPEQRTKLLQCLYGALSSYIGEDFSSIIAMCDKAKPI